MPGIQTRNDVRRRLKQYWRDPGNPRLRGLFLAALPNSGADPETVGQCWPTRPDERERHLQTVYGQYDGQPHRVMTAPVKQEFSPGWLFDDFESRPESGVARSLARDHFTQDEDVHKFLSGEETMDLDRYIKRALLQDSPTHLDTLFRKELEDTFVMGAQPRKIFRDAANVRRVNREKGDFPRESDEPYAPIIGHNDEIRTGQQGFDTVSFDCDKIATGFEISDSLMNQSEPDAFASLAEGVGAAVENTLNRKALVTAIDNADSNNDVDADIGGSNEQSAVQALNEAVTNVDINDYGEPDSVVVHPEFEQAIFDDTNVVYANRSGETEPVQDREMGSIMGLGRWKGSDSTYNNAGSASYGKQLSTSNTWGYDGDTEIGAVAFPSRMFNVVIWDDFDMETKSYEDPIRDLEGQNVRTWMDAVYGQQGAGAVIKH
jgi:hypothetical protein